jgi:catechol 2,3-dioxygenase-like lactoylglutathione lyase family enzyme
MKVKGFSWVGIATDDIERSMRFFRDLLGLEVWVEGDEQAILKAPAGPAAGNLRNGRSREGADRFASYCVRGR